MRRPGPFGLRGRSSILRTGALMIGLASPAMPQVDLGRLYAEAQRAQAAGDLATATRKYEAIVRLQPKMAEAYANLGNLYYQRGQTDRAMAAYRKAIEQKPGLAGPNFFLGVIAFDDHNYSSALEHLDRAAAARSSNPLIYAYLGYTRFALAEYREAAGDLEKAAALDAANIDILYHLSKAYSHLADRAFARLQKDFPDSVYPILVRAHLDETKEDWAGAAKQYGLALEKMPGNARLREKERWTAAKSAGKPPPPGNGAKDDLVDASLAYRDAPPAGPKLKEEIARWQSKVRGLVSTKSDDRDVYVRGEGYQILAYLTSLAVFELDSDSYRAHQLRAQLFEQSNNGEGAVGEYREALKRKPGLRNIHFAIGSLYWKDQRFDDAWPELERELKTNPHHPQALYELGDICAFTGRSAEAEKYFLQALKVDPGMGIAHYALEKIYTESGRYYKSLEHLRAAMKLDDSDPTAHYRLAVVYRKLGRTQDAERELALFDQRRTRPHALQSGSSTVK